MEFVENKKDPAATGFDIQLKNRENKVVGNQNVTISNVNGGENCFWLTPNGENKPVICIDPENNVLTFNNENHIFDAISTENPISAKLSKITMESNQNITFTLETSSGDKTTYKIDGNTVYKQDDTTKKFVPVYRNKGFDIALPKNLIDQVNKNKVVAKEYPYQMFDMLQKEYGFQSFVSKDNKLRLLKSPTGQIYVARGTKVIPTFGQEYFKDGNNSVLGFYTNNAKGIVNGNSTNGIGFKLSEEELQQVANFVEGKVVSADSFKTPENKTEQSVNFRGRANIGDTTKIVDTDPLAPGGDGDGRDEDPPPGPGDPPPGGDGRDEDPPPPGDDGRDEDPPPPPGGDGRDDDPPPPGGGDENPPPGGGSDEDPPGDDGRDEDPPPPPGGGRDDTPPGGNGRDDTPPGGNTNPPPSGGSGDGKKDDKKDKEKEKINLAKPLSAVGYLTFIIMMAAAAFMPLSPVFLFLAMVVFSLATILRTVDLSISTNIHPLKSLRDKFKPKTKEQLLEKSKEPQLNYKQEIERNDLLLKERQGTLTAKERKRLDKLNKLYNKDPLTVRERTRLNKLLAQDGPAAARAREQRQDAEALTRLQDQQFQSDKQRYLDQVQTNIENRERILNLANEGVITITDEQKATLTQEITDFRQFKTDVENGVLNISKTHNDTVIRDLQVAENNISNNNPFGDFDTSDLELTTFDERLESYKRNHTTPTSSTTYSDIVNANRDIIEQHQNGGHDRSDDHTA